MNPLWILLIGMAVVVGGILGLRLHAFLSLVAAALIVAAITPTANIYQWALHAPGGTAATAAAAAGETVGQRVADGFGKTAAGIGILVAMASVLGKTLMESGAAERIVVSCRQALGDRRTALAFLISGFVLGGLILSDTTFYLLIPLAQVMRARTGRDYALYVSAIVAGSVMTHSLMPPAPGPVFVAAALHVNLLSVIIGGAIVGGIAAASGYLYGVWSNSRWDLPLRGAPGVSEAELEAIANREISLLPPLWISLVPIVLPVVLIATAAIFKTHSGQWVRVLENFGNASVALSIAAGIGLLMVSINGTSPRKAATEGLAGGGVMVLIIAAGGAFGHVLQQTNIAEMIHSMLPNAKIALLPLAFILTVAIRTAQGSAIVAMITAAGIVAPLASGGLGYNAVYLVLAIGCGSKPILWMNDAGFWIIGRVSGMTERETLRTASALMCVMGVVGLLATMAGAWMFPLK